MVEIVTSNNLPKPFTFASRQNGVAVLVMLLALLVTSAVYLSTEYKVNNTGQQNRNTLNSLLAAKQALLAYAVNYADNYGHNSRGGPGRLPCPALAKFSSPARSCGENPVGYLPANWSRSGRQMEIDYLERFLDRDIWYAVASDHRYNPAFNTLNSHRGDGLLSVDKMDDVVAVLIAPGPAAETQTLIQTRSSSFQYLSETVIQYLEGDNADGDASYTLTESNDLLVAIRRDELISLMELRVLGFVKQWLIEYKQHYGFYPYAAGLGATGECEQSLQRGMLSVEAGNCAEVPLADVHFSDLPAARSLRQTWFFRYGWPQFIYYVVNENCLPDKAFENCDGVDDAVSALRVDGVPVDVVLLSVGESMETLPIGRLQRRDSTELVEYLDSEDLLLTDLEFRSPTVTELSNDQLVYIEQEVTDGS